MIYLDFETKSRTDLLKAGAWRYSQCESTRILCMAYAIGEGEVKLWIPGEAFPPELQEAIDQGECVEAHNAFFERAIWCNIMIPKYQWSSLKESQWRCSAALAASYGLPRKLNKVGEALKLSQVKDDMGHRVMMKLSKPRKHTKHDKSDWHYNPQDFLTLYQYCKTDVLAERAIANTLRPLPNRELNVWLLDQRINQRGIRVDLEAVEAAIDLAEQYKAQQFELLAMLTDGQVTKATQTARLKQWLEDEGFYLPDLTKGTLDNWIDNPTLSDEAYQVLRIRQITGKTSISKFDRIKASVCEDGYLRGLLLYHGAGTGRWAGRGAQPQNLPRNKHKGDLEELFELIKQRDLSEFQTQYPEVMDTLSHALRGTFIPATGAEFMGGDYNAIETRTLFWLADQTQGLDDFRSGVDLYVKMAQIIFDKKDISPDERQLGKQAVLGCGYQMGASKFQKTCAGYGIDITIELAEKAVTMYRKTFRSVVRLWDAQNKAALYAMTSGKRITSGKVTWWKDSRFLYCQLPSGRNIAYCQPRVGQGETPWGETVNKLFYWHEDSVSRKWVETHTYGGKLVENITQAVARDVLAEAMLRCESSGYPVVMTIHDEILVEVECEDEEKSVAEFEAIMSEEAPWAKGLPLRVEGWKGKRYLK